MRGSVLALGFEPSHDLPATCRNLRPALTAPSPISRCRWQAASHSSRHRRPPWPRVGCPRRGAAGGPWQLAAWRCCWARRCRAGEPAGRCCLAADAWRGWGWASWDTRPPFTSAQVCWRGPGENEHALLAHCCWPAGRSACVPTRLQRSIFPVPVPIPVPVLFSLQCHQRPPGAPAGEGRQLMAMPAAHAAATAAAAVGNVRLTAQYG